MKKYEVKIKGKLKGNQVELTTTVEVTNSMLIEIVTTKALEEAEYDGISDAQIQKVAEVKASKLQQMNIPFEEPSQDEEETESTESMEDEFETRQYTPYNAIRQQQEEEDLEEESEEDSEEELSSEDEDCCDSYTSYTPYASLKTKNSKEEAISYHPKFTNGYAPYRTRRIIIESKSDIS